MQVLVHLMPFMTTKVSTSTVRVSVELLLRRLLRISSWHVNLFYRSSKHHTFVLVTSHHTSRFPFRSPVPWQNPPPTSTKVNFLFVLIVLTSRLRFIYFVSICYIFHVRLLLSRHFLCYFFIYSSVIHSLYIRQLFFFYSLSIHYLFITLLQLKFS